VQVTLWYTTDCPNWRLADTRLRAAIATIGRADLDVHRVAVDPDTVTAGFAGSPTFTVDGEDLFEVAPANAPACRVYRTANGLAGVPDLAELAAAIRKKIRR
jgi:hypothetical protein